MTETTKPTLYCSPQDLCMAESMPWQQHFECRTLHPLADVLNERFFHNVRSNLRPGDSIAICRFDRAPSSQGTGRLVEFCEVRIVGRTDAGVELYIVREPVAIGAEADPAALTKAPVPDVRYITGSGEVRWNPGRKSYDIVCDGRLILSSIPRERKEWAQAVARGDEPLPADLSKFAA